MWIVGLQTVERARRTRGTAVETVPPWLSPYETRNMHSPYQKWRRQSSGAWEKGEAPGLSQRMLACRGSSASNQEKSNPKSICQSPRCSDKHAGPQERGGKNFLCHNRDWKKTGAAWCHSVLYVMLNDVKHHKQKSKN